MIVTTPHPAQSEFGGIEPLSLPVLHAELLKLRGTLGEDRAMEHNICIQICDRFIDELGQCINLSLNEYPEDKEAYNHVFDGLQGVIDRMHGTKEGLKGSDGQPRLMDDQESRLEAADHLDNVIEQLNQYILIKERALPVPQEPPDDRDDETADAAKQQRRRPR